MLKVSKPASDRLDIELTGSLDADAMATALDDNADSNRRQWTAMDVNGDDNGRQWTSTGH